MNIRYMLVIFAFTAMPGLWAAQEMTKEEIEIQGKFLEAVRYRRLADAEHMLELGADPNVMSTRCVYPPLGQAASNNDVKMVELLLEYRASVNGRDDIGQTPLMIAANRGHSAVVISLFEHNATIIDRDLSKDSPLVNACSRGRKIVNDGKIPFLFLLHPKMTSEEILHGYGRLDRDGRDNLDLCRCLLYCADRDRKYISILRYTRLSQDTAGIVADYAGNSHHISGHPLMKLEILIKKIVDNPDSLDEELIPKVIAEANQKAKELLVEIEEIYTPQFREKLDYLEKMRARYPQRKV